MEIVASFSSAGQSESLRTNQLIFFTKPEYFDMLRGYSLCHEVGTLVGPYGGLPRLEAWRSFSKFIHWLLSEFESSNLD